MEAGLLVSHVSHLTMQPEVNHFLSLNLRGLVSKVKRMIMPSQETRENPMWYWDEAKHLEGIPSWARTQHKDPGASKL